MANGYFRAAMVVFIVAVMLLAIIALWVWSL